MWDKLFTRTYKSIFTFQTHLTFPLCKYVPQLVFFSALITWHLLLPQDLVSVFHHLWHFLTNNLGLVLSFYKFLILKWLPSIWWSQPVEYELIYSWPFPVYKCKLLSFCWFCSVFLLVLLCTNNDMNYFSFVIFCMQLSFYSILNIPSSTFYRASFVAMSI